MKSILLTSTALVAFAGAAAADGHAEAGIAFAGDATLGYNDVVEDGFYWDSSVDVTMTAALDNGLVASATFGLNVSDNDLGEPVSTSDFVLKLAGGGSSLSFGDLDPVAEDRWSGVDGMDADGFNDQDVHFSAAVGFESMLVGETTLGGFTTAVSFGVDADGATIEDGLDAMQLHTTGSFGSVNLQAAYQAEFAGADAVFGISAGTSFAGADVKIAYADNGGDNSIGVSASYPVGPVTLGGYYATNDLGEDNYGLSADYANGPVAVSAFGDFDGDADEWDFGVEGSYDLGNGATVLAGMVDSGDAYYVAGTYDLGGGASILASYADDENNATNDEIGDPEYMAGTTIEVSFSF